MARFLQLLLKIIATVMSNDNILGKDKNFLFHVAWNDIEIVLAPKRKTLVNVMKPISQILSVNIAYLQGLSY